MYAALRPDTGNVWLLPTSLFKEVGTAQVDSKGSAMNIGCRYALVKYATTNMGSSGGKAMGLRMQNQIEKWSIRKKVIWREDMADLVLQLLRNLTRIKLRAALNYAGTRVATAFESLGEYGNVGCVITIPTLFQELKKLEHQLQTVIEAVDRDTQDLRIISERIRRRRIEAGILSEYSYWPSIPRLAKPYRYCLLDYPTINLEGRAVPIYSLTDLFGMAAAAEIVADTRFSDTQSVAILDDDSNRGLQMRLLKLQSYITQAGSQPSSSNVFNEIGSPYGTKRVAKIS
jgi:hypothetical protein